MDKGEKQLILQILQNEPKGVTIQDVCRLGKLNRFTATVYLHELLGEGKITERKIGAYRLFKIK